MKKEIVRADKERWKIVKGKLYDEREKIGEESRRRRGID
jgi:hypothetical protein